ncbi:hypothetical protein Tco_1439421 [Tanacetum coccineum]
MELSSCGIKDEKDFEGGSTATCVSVMESKVQILLWLLEPRMDDGSQLIKLRGTAIKGHLSMVPIDMETQPIILVYIDVNLQRELALISNNIPNSAGARYGGELAPIFKKIGDKQTRSIPEVDISSLLQNASRAVSSVTSEYFRRRDSWPKTNV